MNSIKQMENGEFPLPSREQNNLLSAMPPDVMARLAPHLELVTLAMGLSLYESGDELKYAIFPTNSIVSLIYVMANGDSAELSVIGNDGILGVPLLLGGNSTPHRAIVQSAGNAYRLPGHLLKEEFNRSSESRQVLLSYTQSLMTQMAQTSACNRHHSVDQRLSRWLLLSLDRIPSNILTVTQELMANMLGVRREGVSLAAAKLQRLGAIEYHRGRLVIQDRVKLEKLSCECYDVVKKECQRLMLDSNSRHGKKTCA